MITSPYKDIREVFAKAEILEEFLMDTQKELKINSAWCKGCGICAAFCPKGALEMVGDKVQRKEGTECILCGLCELRCPDYAIYIDEKDVEVEQWVQSY